MDLEPGLFDVMPSVSAKSADGGLAEVEAWFQTQPSMIERFASSFRQALDEVMDGQRTGRFDLTTLEKTEKTYIGTKVEIVLRDEFGLGRGKAMDYRIAGHEVDSKFTINSNWSIPREAMGHLCLLMSADDKRSRFRVGLLRVDEQLLNNGRNGDRKATVSLEGRTAVRWLIPEGALPENVLLHMPANDRYAIFRASENYRGAGNGGQLRINELLRRVQGRIIDRTTAMTVASQLDGPKRMRDARIHLRSEGTVVLGNYDHHRVIAQALGLPVPPKGSWVAARLVRYPAGDPLRTVVISGQRYALARPGEPPEPGPSEY